jgi:signal transduction histidine kinase
MAAGMHLSDLHAPVVVCSADGTVVNATDEARELLGRVHGSQPSSGQVPGELWEHLQAVPVGEAVDWRPPGNERSVLGCTRYGFGEHYLLLMKEVSHKHAALSRRMHSQRLEATGRLVASVAHELRNAVASIVYSAELLDLGGMDIPRETLSDTVVEMVAASRQLQSSVNSLLGYARLGPSVNVPVSLREVMTRAQGFLRSVYREGDRHLQVEIPVAADWVQGNTLIVEQIFVNLLLNAAEATSGPLLVRVQSDLAVPPGALPGTPMHVRVRVVDNGPGIPQRLRHSVFQPFFSTREQGTGLGLTIASEAAASLGGYLILEPPTVPGTCFAVYLPRPQGEGERGA